MSQESIIPPNRLKRNLLAGHLQVGMFVAEFRQPSVMQILANAGFDFALIDNEHGGFGIETIGDLSRAAVLMGITPLVRVPDIAYPYIAQTLDVGAQGLMIPRVTNAEQVRSVVQQMRYPPLGERGSALERGFTRFRRAPVQEVLDSVHRETMLVIQIETRQALENLDEILAVPGVDVALIGPNDLGIALGVPGQLEAPVLVEAIEKTISTCQQRLVCPAIAMGDPRLAVAWARRGMRMILAGSEIALMMRAGQEVLTAIQDGVAHGN